MSGKRLSAKGVGRAFFVAAAGTGLVLGAVRAPGTWAIQGPAASVAEIASPAAVQRVQLICAGPELMGAQGVEDTTFGGRLAVASVPQTLLGGLKLPSKPGVLSVRSMASGKDDGQTDERVRGTTLMHPYAGAHAVQVTGTESLAAGVVASQAWAAASADFRGFGSSTCGPATADAWLLAGGGQAGRQERLLLANPGANPVTVDVAVHGAQGIVESPNGHDVVVPGHRRVNLLVDSIAGDEKSPAIHVTTTGGLVRAVLNDTWVDGSLPAGSDDVAPAAPPSRQQVIPAVAIGESATLRIAVPGEREAVVQARALSSNGPKPLPTAGVSRVPGGAVADIDVSKLGGGVYGIEVRADVPVVASAIVSRRPSPTSVGDFAWGSSTLPAQRLLGIAIPEREAGESVSGAIFRRLSLVGTGSDVTADVSEVTKGGDVTTQRVSIGADSVGAVDLADDTQAVWVRRVSGGSLRASLVSVINQSAQLITITPLVEPQFEASATRVAPLP